MSVRRAAALLLALTAAAYVWSALGGSAGGSAARQALRPLPRTLASALHSSSASPSPPHPSSLSPLSPFPSLSATSSATSSSSHWPGVGLSSLSSPASTASGRSSLSSESSSARSSLPTVGVSTTALLPSSSSASCDSIDCASRHGILEPSWARLSFQPAIDWLGGGVRGDCVAGELEYILPKYCTPPTERQPKGGWPSEDRLRLADVHSNGLPQGTMSELSTLLAGKTLLVMGDSVMEQFYNVLQCLLRKERLLARHSDDFEAFIQANKPLWTMGKRKKPPKLPQQTHSGMRMLYARVTTMQPDEVDAAVNTADVIVLNWGLHYQNMPTYRSDLQSAMTKLERHATATGKAAVFMETGAQHFKASDRRGYRTGEWENRDKSTDKECSCQATEDFNVNSRNRVLYEVLSSGRFGHVSLLPFYNLTRPRWRWHFGNCTHRPNGWNFYTCCDCTHFCYSPTMWGAHLHNLLQVLRRHHIAQTHA